MTERIRPDIHVRSGSACDSAARISELALRKDDAQRKNRTLTVARRKNHSALCDAQWIDIRNSGRNSAHYCKKYFRRFRIFPIEHAAMWNVIRV
jgi:hypothetical protein